MRVVLKYVLPAVAFALLVVGVSALWAFSSLEEAARQRMHLEILRLSYQFLVIVLLGLLVTTSLEAGRERRADMQVDRSRKEGFLKSLVDLTHDVDLARLLIMANRSVRTWDTQMNERIIPAYIRLRDLSHDAKTSSAAQVPIFTRSDEVLSGLGLMRTYIQPLVEEFAEHKKELSELQGRAEKDRSLQKQLWEEMLTLPEVGDLVRDGDKYQGFREAYGQLLQVVRSDLSLRGSRPRHGA